jgi:hypothetical protein
VQVPATPAVPIGPIPEALREWRAAAPGRAFHVDYLGRVHLHDFGQAVRSFPCVADAVAAIG